MDGKIESSSSGDDNNDESIEQDSKQKNLNIL